ncbi:hypothetical protein NDR87_37065 [Nocardia sp. CDC159]|uniref:Helix-turn-helix protein n=1 Tax=Nocardia pulmonis TaxID=2951408 RepID=A0A9X2EDU0_9NOCA|nr:MULTISPECIES: hypothetical protein [Nocardia]MCM6779097.1 hypothetical protein [Nocardia pulmonis]MCM6791985.1 hypothetical protein [Nocardia sp. CDC159]
MRSIQYEDSRGRPQRLTYTQWRYLDEVDRRGRLEYGWGGYTSTLTVRLLRERGLITVADRWQRTESGGLVLRWEISGLTKLGARVHAKANEHPERP